MLVRFVFCGLITTVLKIDACKSTTKIMKTTQKPTGGYRSFLLFCGLILFKQADILAFSVGDEVETTGPVFVRSTAAGSILGSQNSEVIGTITDGPTVAILNGTSYTWYDINYPSSPSGWVASINLESAPPTVSTLAASLVTTDSAMLNSTVYPNSSSTSIYFEYGTTATYGSSTATLGIGTSSGNYGRLVSGLSPNTTYHFRIVAYNGTGLSQGPDSTFQTSVQPTPIVSTLQASSILASSATLNASIDPNGANTTFYFQFGLATDYGNTTTSGSTTVLLDVGDPISGLVANTVYHYRIVANNQGGTSYGNDLTFTTSMPVNSLTIIPIFDSTITNDLQATTIEATINSAIAVYESKFSDPITVFIRFQEVTSGLGASKKNAITILYSDYIAALTTHATTADDAMALAHLPNTANNPVNGNEEININLPLARALGFSADPPPGQPDGIVALNTGIMNLSADQTNPNDYSLFAAASHEIDEVLGLGSALNGRSNGDPYPTDAIMPEDLFRYDQNGVRSFTTDPNAIAYFSLDGVSILAQFNQYSPPPSTFYDFGDWYSLGDTYTPQVQDAFQKPGEEPVLGVELRLLDIIGFHLIGLPPKIDQTVTFAPLANKTFGESSFTVSATASSGLLVSFSILSGPAILSGNNNVTITGIGTVVIQASQAGNENYNAALNVDQSFTIYASPQINIVQSGNAFIINWPINVNNFVLQSTPSLIPPISWSTVTTSPVIVNGLFTVTNDSTVGNMFYRLMK